MLLLRIHTDNAALTPAHVLYPSPLLWISATLLRPAKPIMDKVPLYHGLSGNIPAYSIAADPQLRSKQRRAIFRL